MAPVKIQTYNKTQLAKMYGVDIRTFNAMLETVPFQLKKVGRVLFTPKQVEIIFKNLGAPESEFTER
jgi:hypothetical protein